MNNIAEMQSVFDAKDLRLFARIVNRLEQEGFSPLDLRDFISKEARRDVIPAEVIFSRRERKKWLAALPDAMRGEMKERIAKMRKRSLAQTKSGPLRP
jgi:hypothetical protein